MNTTGSRWMPILWFVAAALAFIAVAIRLTRGGDPNFAVGAGGIFCLIMGIIALRRPRA